MVLELNDDKKFNARMMGTLEERKTIFTNKQRYIGKMLTVRYQQLTEDGVPRFPVGVAVRDYE